MRKSVPKEDAIEADATEVEDVEQAEGVEDFAEDAPAEPDPSGREEVGAVSAEDRGVSASGVEEAVDEELTLEDATRLRAELQALNDKHLRLAAEFNNFRRRTEQERLGVWSRAQADIVGKMLTVLDDLQRVAGLDTSSATVGSIMEGIDLVERKFVRTLREAGVEVHDPDGEAFDPEVMEAMMRVPAESEDQDEKVARVFEKGYSLEGTLIRPARVSVYVVG